jgi:hypothetical protein
MRYPEPDTDHGICDNGQPIAIHHFGQAFTGHIFVR